MIVNYLATRNSVQVRILAGPPLNFYGSVAELADAAGCKIETILPKLTD
jgi:hypothetical protein